MKLPVAAAALLVAGLLTTTTAAEAQTATPFTGAGQRRQAAPKKRKASEADIARMQQRMNMNEGEVKRDQQQEVLDARAGISSNSLSSGSSAGRHYDRASGGFTVRKFRDKRNMAVQKRGQTRPAPGIDPPGKPLKHKQPGRKRFLLF